MTKIDVHFAAFSTRVNPITSSVYSGRLDAVIAVADPKRWVLIPAMIKNIMASIGGITLMQTSAARFEEKDDSSDPNRFIAP
jgi:hypothetical protein